MLARPIALALLTTVLGACSGVSPAESPPSPPTIQAIGTLAAARTSGALHAFTLTDGRSFEANTDMGQLVLFRGGALGAPFVTGLEDGRTFAAGFVHQDGLPADCWLPGIGELGIERGSFVEIGGVLWRKSLSFVSDVALPAVGEPFPASARFCFDANALVTRVVG